MEIQGTKKSMNIFVDSVDGYLSDSSNKVLCDTSSTDKLLCKSGEEIAAQHSLSAESAPKKQLSILTNINPRQQNEEYQECCIKFVEECKEYLNQFSSYAHTGFTKGKQLQDLHVQLNNMQLILDTLQTLPPTKSSNESKVEVKQGSLSTKDDKKLDDKQKRAIYELEVKNKLNELLEILDRISGFVDPSKLQTLKYVQEFIAKEVDPDKLSDQFSVLVDILYDIEYRHDSREIENKVSKLRETITAAANGFCVCNERVHKDSLTKLQGLSPKKQPKTKTTTEDILRDKYTKECERLHAEKDELIHKCFDSSQAEQDLVNEHIKLIDLKIEVLYSKQQSLLKYTDFDNKDCNTKAMCVNIAGKNKTIEINNEILKENKKKIKENNNLIKTIKKLSYRTPQNLSTSKYKDFIKQIKKKNDELKLENKNLKKYSKKLSKDVAKILKNLKSKVKKAHENPRIQKIIACLKQLGNIDDIYKERLTVWNIEQDEVPPLASSSETHQARGNNVPSVPQEGASENIQATQQTTTTEQTSTQIHDDSPSFSLSSETHEASDNNGSLKMDARTKILKHISDKLPETWVANKNIPDSNRVEKYVKEFQNFKKLYMNSENQEENSMNSENQEESSLGDVTIDQKKYIQYLGVNRFDGTKKCSVEEAFQQIQSHEENIEYINIFIKLNKQVIDKNRALIKSSKEHPTRHEQKTVEFLKKHNKVLEKANKRLESNLSALLKDIEKLSKHINKICKQKSQQQLNNNALRTSTQTPQESTKDSTSNQVAAQIDIHYQKTEVTTEQDTGTTAASAE